MPDWAIGDGFVRNIVWDHLQGLNRRMPLPDIDILDFDKLIRPPSYDQEIERQLTADFPDLPWSVGNQARMHIRIVTNPIREPGTPCATGWKNQQPLLSG